MTSGSMIPQGPTMVRAFHIPAHRDRADAFAVTRRNRCTVSSCSGRQSPINDPSNIPESTRPITSPELDGHAGFCAKSSSHQLQRHHPYVRSSSNNSRPSSPQSPQLVTSVPIMHSLPTMSTVNFMESAHVQQQEKHCQTYPAIIGHSRLMQEGLAIAVERIGAQRRLRSSSSSLSVYLLPATPVPEPIVAQHNYYCNPENTAVVEDCDTNGNKVRRHSSCPAITAYSDYPHYYKSTDLLVPDDSKSEVAYYYSRSSACEQADVWRPW